MHSVNVDAFGRWVHNNQMDRAALAKRIRQRALALDIGGQVALAKKAGLALGTVHRILKGAKPSSHTSYEALARALDWTIEELLAGDRPAAPPTPAEAAVLNAESLAMAARYQSASTDVRLRVRQLLASGTEADELDALIDAAYANAKGRKQSRKRKRSRSA